MNRSWIVAVLAVLALAFAVQPSATEQPPVETGSEMLEEVAGVRRSLDSLVDMVAELLDNQQVELVLKRIDLKQRRLAPLERELRSVAGSVTGRKSELHQLNEIVIEAEDQVQSEIREGIDHPDSNAREYLKSMEREIRFQTNELEAIMERRRRLEDELADEQREIEILDDQLNELLDR